jgi:poly(3-hydroxybutyrate) depolymerase
MSDQDPPAGIDDLKFTGQLLDRIGERLCIDEDRVYVAGLGTGGGMAQLVACDEVLSKRVAAYGLVNANIFQGFREVAAESEDDAARNEALDEVWRKCNPGRLPVRMLTIGTENNTVFDYWGKVEVGGRPRVPSIKSLVDWAQKDVCGPALDMPKNWRGPDDVLYKTVLEKGYIFEGFIEHSSITKATYHCWGTNLYDVPLAKKKKTPPKAADVDGKPEPGADAKDDALSLKEREEKKKADDLNEFVEKLRESFVLEHYLIRGLDHGWPRVEGAATVADDPTASTASNDATGDSVKTVRRDEHRWRHVAGPMRTEVDLGFNLDGAYTFHWGFSDPEPKGRLARFDATARLLDFFRQFRLSDDLPSSPRDDEGMTEAEQNDFGSFVKTLMDAQDKDVNKFKKVKTTLEELTGGDDDEPIKKPVRDEL